MTDPVLRPNRCVFSGGYPYPREAEEYIKGPVWTVLTHESDAHFSGCSLDNHGPLVTPGVGGGWSGGAKVLCILDHRGVQLILAYSWVRPAILVVGKGRGGMFLFLLFLHFHSCSSFFPVPLFHLLYSSISFLPFSGSDTK